jgi:hypothetical protein
MTSQQDFQIPYSIRYPQMPLHLTVRYQPFFEMQVTSPRLWEVSRQNSKSFIIHDRWTWVALIFWFAIKFTRLWEMSRGVISLHPVETHGWRQNIFNLLICNVPEHRNFKIYFGFIAGRISWKRKECYKSFRTLSFLQTEVWIQTSQEYHPYFWKTSHIIGNSEHSSKGSFSHLWKIVSKV